MAKDYSSMTRAELLAEAYDLILELPAEKLDRLIEEWKRQEQEELHDRRNKALPSGG